MKEYQFKTNIKCGGCIAGVTPHLDDQEDIQKWNVDITVPEKLLTVKTKSLTKDQIIDIVNKAGYKAELKVND